MPTNQATKTKEKRKKKKSLRHNEYYDIQNVFDDLYEKSKQGKVFKNLLELMLDERNIKLAYRNIKRNSGSMTAGVNKTKIDLWANEETENYINYVKKRLENYQPHKVKRVEIPKPNGKTRPLGIPTIEDRLIQQCIKQILDPICEAKFHHNSYEFRPNRSTEHAVARFVHFINISHLHHVVDIDIKGFFDNVNHGKLLKQIWNFGIRDKKLISIISKMLKAEIEGIGKPEKGTPQGGILSPLLSNIVLNELDWWISNQWETFNTDKEYSIQCSKILSLKTKSKLKEVYIVRYADDFKLICKDAETARKMYIATTNWLKERLQLEVSSEKSKIIDLKISSSEFLGFRIKAKTKNKKYVAISHITEKAKQNCIKNLTLNIKAIQKESSGKAVLKYNSTVLGIQNYYKIATHVNLDFSIIAFQIDKIIYNRLKSISTNKGTKSKAYNKFYKNNYKTVYVQGIALYPIADIQHSYPRIFTQSKCLYTKIGRELIHDNLKNYDMEIVHYLMNNPIKGKSVEYNDNRISLYVGQNGKCGITGITLQIGEMETHHKTPIKDGGTDDYKNLIFISSNVHKLIHATNTGIINEYSKTINLSEENRKKINKLREKVGNFVIN